MSTIEVFLMLPIRKKFNYSWVIVALSCLMVMTVLGFCSSSKSIFISPVCSALDMSRSVFSFNETCRYITTSVVNIFFGALIYRFGAKKLIFVGFISLIASMLTYSFATNVIGFCIGGVLLGLGLSFTTTTMVGAVVNKWCKKNKGTIMGLALASNGIGAAIAIQILSPIIHSGNSFAYRNAYRLSAVILAVVLVLILVFFKNAPKNADKKAIEADAQPEKKAKPDYKAILKTPYLYPAAIFIFTAGMVLQSVYGIAAPLFEDSGISTSDVANILSISSMLLFVTKFSVGFIYDKSGVRHTSTICYSSAIVAIVLLFSVSGSGNTILAYTYTAFAALSLPLETIMLPIYARELFGEKKFNEALGIFVSVNTAGYAVGAPLANLCYDLFGNYNVCLYISIGLMLIALVTVHIVISISKKYKNAEA